MKPDYQRIETETFKMINQLRNTPSSFIKDLEKLALAFNGKTYRLPGSKVNIVTAEGRYAVDDAIKYLKVEIFPLLLSPLPCGFLYWKSLITPIEILKIFNRLF